MSTSNFSRFLATDITEQGQDTWSKDLERGDARAPIEPVAPGVNTNTNTITSTKPLPPPYQSEMGLVDSNTSTAPRPANTLSKSSVVRLYVICSVITGVICVVVVVSICVQQLRAGQLRSEPAGGN
jgi:hypothetical protein